MTASYAPANLGELLGAGRRVYGPNWNDDIDVTLRKLWRDYSSRLKRLARAAQAGKPARHHFHYAVAGRAARLCTFLLAYPKGRPPLTAHEVERQIAMVNPRAPSGEPVRAWAAPKASGGVRLLVAFGPRARAAQLLVRHAMAAKFGESPSEYARKGRGRDALIARLLHLITHHGVRRVCHLDIVSFFPSVRKEVLPDLIPIPKSMVTNTITIPTNTPITIHTNDTLFDENTVRAGLPQGSLLSPFIAAKLLEPVLAGTAQGEWLAYVDNILCGAPDDATAAEAMKALAERSLSIPPDRS